MRIARALVAGLVVLACAPAGSSEAAPRESRATKAKAGKSKKHDVKPRERASRVESARRDRPSAEAPSKTRKGAKRRVAQLSGEARLRKGSSEPDSKPKHDPRARARARCRSCRSHPLPGRHGGRRRARLRRPLRSEPRRSRRAVAAGRLSMRRISSEPTASSTSTRCAWSGALPIASRRRCRSHLCRTSSRAASRVAARCAASGLHERGAGRGRLRCGGQTPLHRSRVGDGLPWRSAARLPLRRSLRTGDLQRVPRAPPVDAPARERLALPRRSAQPGARRRGPDAPARDGRVAALREQVGRRRVFDMVGNLDEWIASDDGVFVGGFYSRGTRSGCASRVSSHVKSYADYSTGLRCCSDPEAPAP
jgi:hypothetical protein